VYESKKKKRKRTNKPQEPDDALESPLPG